MRTRRRFRAAGNETETNQRSKASIIMSPQTEKRMSSQRLKVDYDYEAVILREIPLKSLRIAVAGRYGNRR